MAQPKLDIIMAAIPKEIGDENANLFDATEKLEAINRARGTVYTDLLHEIKDEMIFMNLYPEFNGMEAIAISSNVITKTAAIRRAIKILYPSISPTHIIEPVPVGQSLDVMLPSTLSKFKGTSTFPVFSETSGSLLIFGLTISSANGTVQYLKQPVDAIVGVAEPDIIEPYTWLDLIIIEACKNLLRKKQ